MNIMDPRLKSLMLRVPPMVRILFFSWLKGFPPYCDRLIQKLARQFIMQYLRGKVWAMRSAAFTKKRIALADSQAEFDRFCYSCHWDGPSSWDLKFMRLLSNKVWPIHLDRTLGYGSFLANAYLHWLVEQEKPKQKLVVPLPPMPLHRQLRAPKQFHPPRKQPPPPKNTQNRGR